MAIQIDMKSGSISVDDLGVTLRTLLGAAAGGYTDTGKRGWQIMYKGAYIGKVQVASSPRPTVKAVSQTAKGVN